MYFVLQSSYAINEIYNKSFCRYDKHNIDWCFSDPVVVNIVQDIFKELAGNESCAGPLEHRLLPTLVSILQAPDKVPVSLPPVSQLVSPYSKLTVHVYTCIFFRKYFSCSVQNAIALKNLFVS